MSRLAIGLTAILLLAGLAGAPTARAQCMLANPSFELAGSGGAVFAGWNQFGPVGSTTDAPHGAKAARVSGPNSGNWDVAGYWQRIDALPGQRWSATVCGWHSPAKPLVGGARAILNIEWRNSSGNLISYESHVVASPATPAGEVQAFTVDSQPAPAGTASIHFLLGALQGPTDPQPDVYYDQATFEKLGTPSLDDLQWGDFPSGRTVSFSNRSWRVKGSGYYGPGPNLFCDTPTCTWVDVDGRLHLTIRNISGSWYSTEVTLTEPLGYGDYITTTLGRLDTLHPTTVFGIFPWEYGPCYDPANGWWNPYNEIDIEFSRWGNPANDVGQFVAQPYDYPGNIHRFPATFSNNELTSHAMRWLPDRVEYRSWRGGPDDEAPGTLIRSWTYTGPHIPRPDQPRLHLNLWQFSGPPNTLQEVVIDRFTFVGACPGPHCGENQSGVPDRPPVSTVFSTARPNPFRESTTIRFALPRDGIATIDIFDVAGRRVRRLVQGAWPAGEHEAAWDGRDDSGRPLASGIYLYRYQADRIVETQRLALMK